jgi:protein Mpv17|eukprot:COSAG06_NODE_1656_length_8785_cov_23.725996_3_plen_65_part_00
MANDYLPTLLTSYCVWPLVNGLNFRFVPLDYRILVQNCASFGWNLYLSWVVHHDRSTHDDASLK